MIALVIILIRAGLGLDPKALKRLSGMVIRLAIFPSLVEATSMAVMSHFLLRLPWIWSILLG
jgi:NhaP-type Na+/H+ or K+/H+ antiporter